MASQTLTSTVAVAKVNLLPPEIDEKRSARRVQVGLAGALAATVGLVGMVYVGAAGKVGAAESDLASSRSEFTQLQRKETSLKNVADALAALDAKRGLVNLATGQQVKYSQFLTNLSLSMPDNVWLEEVSFNQRLPKATAPTARAATAALAEPGIGEVTFSGVAFDHDDVANWLESLAKTKGYTNVYFSKSTEGKIGARTVYFFESSVTLTEAALAKAPTTTTAVK